MEIDFICDECEMENFKSEVLEEGVVGKKKDHFFAECNFCGHLQDVTLEVEKEEDKDLSFRLDEDFEGEENEGNSTEL